MKTIRELKTLDWSGYSFEEMINISEINPEYIMVNDFKGCKGGSVLCNLCYSDENGVPHIIFNNIECIFKESGIYSYLIFCESDKHKNMINIYLKLIDQVGDEITSWIDEDELELEEDDSFKLRADIRKFKLRTDDDLPYNQKINIPVCVISLSSAIKRRNIYYPNFRLQKCFYESENF